MKKKLALLLAAAMTVASLAGCGEAKTQPQTQTKETTTETKTETETATEEKTSEATGSVYYLNFKPEADEAWQKLAADYTAKTGVDVKIVTAASGTYSETLTAEMGKSSAPTLFQCGNEEGLETWKDYCLDLSNTDFYKEMTTDDFNLKGENGEVYCAGYCYEAFGIITNKTLLKKAGYEVSDIKDFASLKKIAEDIQSRKDELGFAAFTSAGLDGSSSWRFSGHLANMPLFYEFRDDNVTSQPAEIKGTYLNLYKNIWDLYINNATCAPNEITAKTGDESEAEFFNGKAVFYQNGTWEYANLTKNGMTDDDLCMIPIYCGAEGEEKAALCCGTENCWAVNAKASEEDIKATLDFMYWVVTSDEGTQMMAQEFGPIPFKAAKASSNVFFTNANDLIAKGNYVVTWAFNYTPNVDAWREGVVSALQQYSAAGGDWSNVEKAFVNGWAAQYQAVNG
ncbi:MAG: ABC transporter substrate-binding protein [Lachnospiraceae bacterium]|nr:ABC transporter substrate-binding protein [Lachnospiraceae bacterium]